MKYIVPLLLAAISTAFTLIVLYCGYMAVVEDWSWILVGLGFSLTMVVSWLATSAAFDAVKHW